MPRIFETATRPLAAEVRRRSLGGHELTPGGWYADGDLMLATRRTMLTVRAGEGARCHWLDLRDPEPCWSVAVPRIDMRRGSIDDVPRDGRAVVARRGEMRLAGGRRRVRVRRDASQLELPFEDPGTDARTEKRDAVRRFFADIPLCHRTAIAPSQPRWQWELLILFAQGGPAAVELLGSTPALGFALALAPLFSTREPVPPFDEVVTWRQARIADMLGFPASRRGVRALRKIALAELDSRMLLTARRLLRDERVLARVAHLPRLSRALVHVARTPGGFLALGHDLQLALLDPRRGPRLARQFAGTFDRMRRLRERGYALPDTIRSVRHAATVERSMSELVDAMGAFDAPDRVSPPPFPGIPGVIEPLRCSGDFHAEGEAMHNCVRSYVGAAMTGDVALYRVLRPERATLSLERYARSRWRFGELLAFANAPVSTRTRREVEDWLALWREPGRVPAAVEGELGAVYDAEPSVGSGGEPLDAAAGGFRPGGWDDVPF